MKNFFCMLTSSLSSALLLTLAMPGSGGFWPLLFVALLPFFSLLQSRTWRPLFWASLLLGIPYYMGQLYWLINVLQQYGGLPYSLAFSALLLLALYMSLYLMFFSLTARYFMMQLPVGVQLLVIPALWVGLDWVRTYLFSGFPWMDLGYGLVKSPLLQSAELYGHYGLSFLVILFTLFFHHLFRRGREHLSFAARFFRAHGPILSLVLGAVVFYAHFSTNILKSEMAAAPQAKIAVVQGNISQEQKWQSSQRQLTVAKYLQLTEKELKDNQVDLVVWPETALPFYANKAPELSQLRRSLARYDYPLLMGAPSYKIIDRQKRKALFYNSAFLMQSFGDFTGVYHKSHLVPFGEYVPFRKYLPFLEPLVVSVGDFTPGFIDKPLASGQIKAGVLICFESVFPDLARHWVDSGANILVNLTNDAWYGKSSAPVHTLTMSIMRAVESGRSVVRAANTGYSTFIDPAGKLLQLSPLFVSWSGTETLPLLTKRTFFVSWGYLFAPLCLVIALGCLLVLRSFSRK